ncbi:MAG: LysR family transcriptional regulator [Pseudomonadota bacterium]
MDNWDEVRTAFQVARLGTVSGAAEVLGVHHATVIRHIDALEGKLGVKLFQRHARGYTATEAGNDLLLVAQTTDDQFAQLAGRLKGRGASVTGELVVTSLPTFSPLLAPILTAFRAEHEELTVRYLTGDRLFRLEYGEAHVAIRAGSAPDQPDNVVQPFGRTTLALYAADVYIDRYGLPKGESEYESHYFVGHESDTRAPMNRWLREKVPENNIVYRTADNRSYEDGVVAGAGLGLLPVLAARRYPNLTQVAPPSDEWSAPLWLVTHVDLHRTAKVQSFLTFLKAAAKDWVLE